VALGRALSKLGILSRAQAVEAVRAGRVTVDGRPVIDPAALVEPERSRITVDGEMKTRAAWRAIVFHKPRGVVTTRSDPDGRPTVYDALGDAARGLVSVGRLDLSTSGVLLLTTDTQLAHWVADPANQVPRIYVVTVRGRIDESAIGRLTSVAGGGSDRACAVVLRKASGRESHLTIELREGRNRQVRRLFGALGHEVTRLKRVRLGGLQLDALEPGEWRELSRDEIARAFPGAPIARHAKGPGALAVRKR
jgi:23S rRNA pseudouridine2605 synthase